MYSPHHTKKQKQKQKNNPQAWKLFNLNASQNKDKTCLRNIESSVSNNGSNDSRLALNKNSLDKGQA
jgi:hypothetical protein